MSLTARAATARGAGELTHFLTLNDSGFMHASVSLGPIEQLNAEHARPVAVLDLKQSEVLADINNAIEIALDIETDSYHAYQERVCLIQMATSNGDWFYDPLCGLSAELSSYLAAPTAILVMHAADNDVRSLKRDFGLTLGPIFDTSLAAKILGLKKTGLKDLLESYLEISIDKAEQRSDWSKRPLGLDQLRYARQDVQWLIPLAQSLRKELEQKGRLSWHQEECERVRWSEPTPKVFDVESWRKVKGVKTLGARGRAVMSAIWSWREAEAQGQNLAPFRVARADQLLRVAKVADAHGKKTLKKVSEFRFLPSDIDRDGLQSAVEIGLTAKDPGTRRPQKSSEEGAKAQPPTQETRERLHRLKQQRERWSVALGLEPGFLLTNQQLERIARAMPRSMDELRNVKGLGSWRTDVLGQEILDVV